MNIAELIALTAVVTELVKKALLRIRIEVKGKLAVLLAVLVSAGVVFFDAVKNGTELSFQSFLIFIQVAFGSTLGYSIVTKKSSEKEI